MARKVIDIDERGRKSFQTENFNLEQFKESLSKNDNIMMSFATFEHGSQLNIMAPLADLDLHKFLLGEYDDFHQRCPGFTPQYLLKETWCLSVALKHLHEGLTLPSGRVSCAHLDLKPENILVEWSTKAVPMDLPVGRWKISDFGISVVQPLDNVGGRSGLAAGPHLTPGDVIRERSIKPPRDAGPFQAPEMQAREGLRVSTSSDRWSFGCIVTMILAFTLGGPEKVRELYKCRNEAYPDDYFYIDTPKDGPVVKSEIKRWLSHQAEVDIYKNHRKWIRKCDELINGLLAIKQEFRSRNIGTLLEEIRALIEELPTEQRRPLWTPVRTQPQQPSRIPMREHTPRVPQQVLTQNPRPDLQAPFQLLNTPEPSTFARLEVPPNVKQTVLSPCGRRVAFLSANIVYVYALDQLHQQKDRWTSQNALRRTERNSVQQFSQFSHSCRTRQWRSVLLAGDFIALKSKHSNDSTVRYPLFTGSL